MIRAVCSIAVAVSFTLAHTTPTESRSRTIVLDSVRIARSIFPCGPRRICLERWRTLGGRHTEIQLDSIAKLATSIGFGSVAVKARSEPGACSRAESLPRTVAITLYWSNGVTKKITDGQACSTGTLAPASRVADLRRLRSQVANSVGWLGE